MSEQQKSYEELINEKSVVEKIAEFFKTYKVALFIGIGFICFFGIILIMHVTKLSSSRSLDTITNSLGASDTLIAVLSFITVVMFIINIYFYCLFIRHKELPPKTKVSRALVTIISLIIALFILLLDAKNIWIVLLLTLLCIINHCISLTYKEKWDMPYYLKDIVGLQVIGTIIAVFQALIAWPQLKSAWEAATSDDIDKLQQTLSEFYNHVENYVIVDIPDSLMNDEVKQARYFQKQIYTYSLAIVNQEDWRIDEADNIKIDSIDWHNVEKQYGLDKDIAKCSTNIIQNIMWRKKLDIKMERNQTLFQNLNITLQNITTYYNNCYKDSVIMAAQINTSIMKEILLEMNQLTETYKQLNKNQNKEKNILNQLKQKDSNLSIKLQELSDLENQNRQLVQKMYYSGVLIRLYKLYDKMCIDYISTLNLIQLKYAYNIDPYKPYVMR